MTDAEKAILQTLAYSSVFQFPLTKDELWQFLISDKPIAKEDFLKALKMLPKQIVYKSGFYATMDISNVGMIRQKNKQEVQNKMRLAKQAAYYISYIPSIQLIGISGGLATGSVSEQDDIDLFIVTKKNTLFITRLWIHAILEMLNVRRKRGQQDAPDKICVNLLIDERKLGWPEYLHDIYTAHEIAYMKPLFERNRTYQLFLDANQWVLSMMPHAFDEKPIILGNSWKRRYITLSVISAISNIRPFEKLAYLLQKLYMNRHRTTETVTEQLLAFHPYDYRSKTLADLNIKLQQLGLLTNK